MKRLLLFCLFFAYSIYATENNGSVKSDVPTQPEKADKEQKQSSPEAVKKAEESRLELEKLTKDIESSQLQLMAGVQWPHYNRTLKKADEFLNEGRAADAQEKFETAIKLVQGFIADCKIKMLPNGDMKMGGVTLHIKKEMLSFSAKTEVIEDMPTEVLVCTDRGRIHETIFVSEIRPFHFQTLLHALGAENGARVPTEKFPKQGDFLRVHVEWKMADGKTMREPIEYFMKDEAGKKLKVEPRWVFVGSGMHKGSFIADWSGDVIVNYSVADSIVDCAEEDISNLKRSLSSWFPKGMKSGTEVKILVSIWKNAKPSQQEKK